MIGPLEDAQGQDDAEFGGNAPEVLDRRMPVDWQCPIEMLGQHVLAEVRTLEQLGDEHQLSAFGGRLATSRSAVATLTSTLSTIAIWIAETVSPIRPQL